jgi:hypothetical protein
MPTIKKLLILFVVFVIFGCVAAGAQEPNQQDFVAGAGYGIVGASLARAEEAVCRSMVNYSHLKGAFGEAVMDRVAPSSGRSGKWQVLSLSPKPQGIDGLYIKRNSLGHPKGLMVGEAKFGTSQLGMTIDGRQLSTTWTSNRLSYEASRYIKAGGATSVELGARPRGMAQNPDVVRVRLGDGRDGHFWRNNKFDPWAYDGPKGTLDVAKRAALRDGEYLKAVAEGRVQSLRRSVFKVDVIGDTINIKIQEAKPSSPDNISLGKRATVKIDAATRMSYMRKTKTEIARQLLVKNPHLTEEEAKTIAATATRKMRTLEAILRQQQRPYWVSVFSDSAKAGVVGGVLAGALDVASQMYSKGDVDWSQAGGMAIVGAGSAGAGALAKHLVVGAAINNATVNQFFIQTANAVGLPTGMAAANIVGLGVGGIFGSFVFASAMYCAGQMEGGDAARMAAAGATGSIAGMAAGSGLVALATMYGTAGTGVAISSLSGAAANSAALALLGGGTLAAGGGGAALGLIVASGGAAIVMVATTAVIYWGYSVYDDNESSQRHQYSSNSLMCNSSVVHELCRRRWFPDVTVEQ